MGFFVLMELWWYESDFQLKLNEFVRHERWNYE
jgi:hypothetical protein